MPALPSSPPPNPSSFRVATSTTPRSHSADTADLSLFRTSFLARALSTAAPSSLALKLSWIERLSSPSGAPLSDLRTAATVLDAASYDDLLEERWSDGRCPYPACGNEAGETYRPPEERERDDRRLRVRMRANGLFEVPPSSEGGKGAYCSARCRARSEWYKGLVGRGKSVEGELLEDVEERRKEVALSTEELVRQATETARRTEQGPGDAKGKARAADASTSSQRTDDFRQDLLSSLTIRENDPSSTAVPLPPSLDAPAQDFERPRRDEPPSSSRATRFPASPAPRSGSSSTATSSSGSSLLPFSASRLSNAVLSALPPAPRPGPNGLPPIRFLSAPRTLDNDAETSAFAFEEEEESEEVKRMVEEGLRERNEARRRGEIE